MRFSSFHPATTGVQGSAPSNIGTIASITNAPVISLSTFIAKDGIVKSYLSGSWDAVAEATTYDIEINNGTAWVISSPVASLKNFEVEIKPSALTYSIRVKGSNKNGLRSGSWSPVSNSVVANGDVTGPGLVTGITGITVDFSSILLSWTNPSDSDLAYVEIRHSLTNDVGTSTSIGKISGTTFNHSKRAEGTTNYYWLRGVDTSGNLGSYATVVSVVMPSVFYDTVPATVSGTPTFTTAVSIAPDGTTVGRMAASWAAVSNAVSYIVHVENTTTSISREYPSPNNSTSLNNIDVIPGHNYRIKVKAVNNISILSAAWSNVSATAVAVGDTTAPGPVTTVTANASLTIVTFTWEDPVVADLNHIRLYKNSTNSIPAKATVYMPLGGRFQYIHNNQGATEYYWLSAVDHSGNESTKVATGAVNIPIAGTVNPDAGTYGSATRSTVITVGLNGLVSASSDVLITPAWSSIASKPTTVAGFGITDAAASAAFTSPTKSLSAIDSRAITNPTTGIGYSGGGRFRFSSLNDDSSTPYADVIDLSTYTDSSGGGFNSLYFSKSTQIILHKWAAAGGTSWTSKTLAYTDSSITGSAATLTTGRTIGMTGDVTWTSAAFNGSGNVTGTATLATVATAGTYRSVTINAKGLVTSGTNPTTLSGYGITDAVSTSTYTAADVLSKLLTVDGAGSGLDADLLDGFSGTDYARINTDVTFATLTANRIYTTDNYTQAVLNPTMDMASWFGASTTTLSGIVTDRFAFTPPTTATWSTDGTNFSSITIPTEIFKGMISNQWSGFDIPSTVQKVRFTWSPIGYIFIDNFVASCSTNGNNIRFIFEKSETGATWLPYYTSGWASTWPGYITHKMNGTPSSSHPHFRVTIERTATNSNNVNIGGMSLMTDYGGSSPLYTWNASKVITFAATPTVNGNTVWNAGNDGSGSGLDADLLDGLDSTQYARLATTSTFTAQQVISGQVAANDWTNYGLQIREVGLVAAAQSSGSYNPSIAFHWAGRTVNRLNMNATGVLLWGTDSLWHTGNDGAGSGLDADLLDGLNSSVTSVASTIATRDVSAGLTAHNYNVVAGAGLGIRFWESSTYSIYMSDAGNGTWGGRVTTDGTSDYNMYFKMQDGTNRGFVFLNGTTPTAGIDGTGNIRSKGFVKSSNGVVDLGTTLGSTLSSRYLIPGGGSYTTQTSSVTGAIRIRLPTKGSSAMLKMRIEIFQYNTGKCSSFMISGYPYVPSAGVTNWVNVSAEQHTDNDIQYTVRYGYDGTYDYVYIGEVSTVWAYPQVFLKEFMLGYSGHSDSWSSNWAINFVTSFDTITATRSAARHFNSTNSPSHSELANSPMVTDGTGYGNQRVIRNSSGGTADGMYIGYGNASSGLTRIYGGGSTSTHLSITTTSMTAPGEVYTPSGSYFRAVGTGGFYCETYNGGWNMTDGTWLRSIADKGILTGGAIQGATVTATSDLRLKENVTDLSHALDLVLAMQPRRFNWKKDGRSDIGAIAQELELIVPEVVYNGADDTKTVNYGALGIVAIAAIQELHEIVAALKTRIKVLEAK